MRRIFFLGLYNSFKAETQKKGAIRLLLVQQEKGH
jgi:hypothetical protein